MPRFKVNRWWTLILTLVLGFALVACMSTRATAGSRMTDEMGQRYGGGTPPPPGDGDPDTPMSSFKQARSGAAWQPVAATSTRRVAGDVMPVDSVMMWHFRVVMQSLGFWQFGRF